MAKDWWRIEGTFRDGSYRVRDAQGQYKSLSVAILEETSEIDLFDEDELAQRFDVDRKIILEHLEHLKREGLVEGGEGTWTKPKDFDPQHCSKRELTEEEEWEYHDDDSLY